MSNTLLPQVLLISLAAALLFLLLSRVFARVAVRPGARMLVWWVLVLQLCLPVGLTLPGGSPAIAPPDVTVYTASREIPAPVETPAAAPDAAATLTVSSQLTLWEVLTWLWLLGAAGCFLYQMVGYLYQRRRLLQGSRAASPELQEQLDDLRRTLRIRRKLPLLIAPAAPTPLLLGFFRTRVLLPRAEYPPEELRLILRHELTHARRRDLLFKLAMLLAHAVHWFNPVLPRLRRAAEADMELACDEAALRGAVPDDRRAYSRAILSSMEPVSARLSGLTTGFQGGADLMKTRVNAILAPAPSRRGRALIALVLALVLLISVLAGCVGDAFPEKEDGLYDLGSIADLIRIRGQNVDVRYFPEDMTLDDFLNRFGLTLEEANPYHDDGNPVQSYRAYDCLLFDETGEQPWSVGISTLEDGRIRNLSLSTAFWGVHWEDAMKDAEAILAILDDACGKTITQQEWMKNADYSSVVVNDFGDSLDSLKDLGNSFWREYLFMKTQEHIHITISRNAMYADTTERAGANYDEVFNITIGVVINPPES